jgi:hypothetical protein
MRFVEVRSDDLERDGTKRMGVWGTLLDIFDRAGAGSSPFASPRMFAGVADEVY